MAIHTEGSTRMIVSVMHGGIPDELDEPVTAGITRPYPAPAARVRVRPPVDAR